jgi:hypothetical protein
MKIVCRTTFDCSYTGVTGHFRSSEIPFADRAGQLITDQTAWHRSRNQQRNWETLMQVIGLKTQPLSVTKPIHKDGVWEFEFVAEAEGVFSIIDNTDPVAGLKQDFDGVPIMVNLNEKAGVVSIVTTTGTDQNIWLDTINNVLD